MGKCLCFSRLMPKPEAEDEGGDSLPPIFCSSACLKLGVSVGIWCRRPWPVHVKFIYLKAIRTHTWSRLQLCRRQR